MAPVLSDGGTTVLFHDAQDINKVKADIDLDNVVLTDAQKFRLAGQCIKTADFWLLYAMQFLSIGKFTLDFLIARQSYH